MMNLSVRKFLFHLGYSIVQTMRKEFESIPFTPLTVLMTMHRLLTNHRGKCVLIISTTYDLYFINFSLLDITLGMTDRQS